MNTRKKSSIRCAIYTRKSTEEGLEQEFNSLDAQRDAGQAYIASQRHAGWIPITEHYDDGGFSGGSMHRPALQRLLADITAGKIDCVLVHRVDRLSRSLLDFAKMMEIFDKYQVAFVSITQQFNSATSMGRLVLNVLLSFAQFEREIISERTRDKIAAARRKGIWAGGMPLLGYDVNDKRKLVIHESEAKQVRTIFALYLQRRSLRRVVEDIERRGWRTKRWQTRQGKQRGGRPFTKSTMHYLLTNVAYIGKVRYKEEAHPGAHQPIIDAETFHKVQRLLGEQDPCDAATKHRSDALLKGLLFCRNCRHAMTPAHSIARGKKYRYYVCTTKQKRGTQACPSRALPAAILEDKIIDQLRTFAADPILWHSHLACLLQTRTDLATLAAEQAALQQNLVQLQQEMRRLGQRLAKGNSTGADDISRLAALREQIATGERRAAELAEDITALRQRDVTQDELARVGGLVNGAWATTPRDQQIRIMRHLLERIDYEAGKISMAFSPSGIKSLAEELTRQQQEANPS